MTQPGNALKARPSHLTAVDNGRQWPSKSLRRTRPLPSQAPYSLSGVIQMSQYSMTPLSSYSEDLGSRKGVHNVFNLRATSASECCIAVLLKT